MAIKKNGYWYDELTSTYYQHEPFKAGDVVKTIINNLANMTHGKAYEVDEARRSESLYVSFRDENNRYTYAYEQKIIVKDDRGFKKELRSKNVTASKEAPVSTILALESNRPTVVVEIIEELKDGKTVLTEVGTPVILGSLSAARTFTTNEISKSIREKNEYKQFRIYQEVSIARAKKPEIEFA